MLIPVGQILSPEQFQKLDLKALQQREILDPAFAGFDAAFNWRDHLRLEMPAQKPEARAIAATLDQLSRTHEGQQLIRQASAMQAFRAASAGMPAVLTIQIGSDSTFDAASGSLRISPEQMLAHRFTSISGRAVPFTLQHVLYHELLHAADGFNHPAHKQLLHEDISRLMTLEGRDPTQGYQQFIFRQMEQNILYFEQAALAETNRFMKKYFCEAARQNMYSEPALKKATPTAIPPHYEFGALTPGRCPNLVISSNMRAAGKR